MPLTETIICHLCEQEKPVDYVYQLVAKICDKCAEYIANQWNFSHSGQYLTLPNPTYRAPKKPIPQKLRWQVFERDGYKCIACGSKHDLTADHKFPEIRGGEATLENLQTLCRSCNSKKSDSYNG